LAIRAFGGLEGGGIGELLEVVLVGPVPYDHLGLKSGAALFAVLPIPRVPLGVVIAAKRHSAVVAMATVAGVRKENIFPLVVADPVPAALGFDQPAGFSTQAASRLG
jgi:hypothetical protein